jgi:hypothetical protein
MHADEISCEGQSPAFVPLNRDRHALFRWDADVPPGSRNSKFLPRTPQNQTMASRESEMGKDSTMSPLGLILVIILIIALLGGFSGRFGGYGYGYGHGGIGVLGVILIILVVLLVMGRI